MLSYKEDSTLVEKINDKLFAKNKSYEDLLNNCEVLIVLDNFREYRVDKYLSVIKEAIENNIEVYLAPGIACEIGNYEIVERCKSISILDGCNYNQNQVDIAFKNFDVNKELTKFNIPIIGIYGMGKNSGKFETQLLTTIAAEKNYKVASIYTNVVGVLFNGHVWPEFLYQNITFKEKIILINDYLQNIIRTEQPDVVIVGVPEGVAPFRSIEMNSFGEYALEISRAAEIDFAILCTYFMIGRVNRAGLTEMIRLLESQFNTQFVGMAISRTMLEVTNDGSNEIIYEVLCDENLEKNYPRCEDINGVTLVELFNSEICISKIENLIGKLKDNVATI